MSITATEIQNVRFGEARRGYNPDEVDEFLERVATDVDTLNRALAEAAARIADAEERARVAEEMLANAPAAAAPDFAEPAPPPAPRGEDGSISEDVISKAFIAAQISADNLKEEARKEAEKLYREADAKAKDIVRDATADRERMLAEIDHLRELSEKFRTEFLSLVNHYTVDAQKRFAEFSELVPMGTDGPSVEQMLDANNAVVSPPDAPAAAAPPQAASGLATAAPGPAPAPAPAAFALDDDLEIEEID